MATPRATITSTTRLLKALGDETRLRILNLLRHEELSGTELMELLNIGQSRVSTHLALLREVGVVSDRRAGRRSLYALARGPAAELCVRVLDENGETSELVTDLAGLEALRTRRRQESRAYFDRVAATFGEQILPGRTWEGLARALLCLAPRVRYADLGIGDGLLTLMLAEVAEKVTAVDHSQEMLHQLELRARNQGIDNIETLEAEIEDLPLPANSHEVVVMSQALHHAREPKVSLREAMRILTPGGLLLVIDLLAHTEEWVRDKLQHVHLGFPEAALEGWIKELGFIDVRVQRAARDPQPPHFMTLIATGRKPEA